MAFLCKNLHQIILNWVYYILKFSHPTYFPLGMPILIYFIGRKKGDIQKFYLIKYLRTSCRYFLRETESGIIYSIYLGGINIKPPSIINSMSLSYFFIISVFILSLYKSLFCLIKRETRSLLNEYYETCRVTKFNIELNCLANIEFGWEKMCHLTIDPHFLQFINFCNPWAF